MQDNQVCYFNEGIYYNIFEHEEIVKETRKMSLTITALGSRFKFNITGFLIVKNVPVIIFPKGYNISDDLESIKKEALVLLKTLMRYRYEAMAYEEQELLFGSDKNNSSRISSAVYIIEDFQRHGLLSRRQMIQSTVKTGHINWNATINKSNPFISHKSSVYLNPVMTSSVIDRNNIIQRIHGYVVNECINIWGWLLGYGSNTIEKTSLPCPMQEAINILKAELVETFVQREINIIKSLIDYLEAMQGSKEKQKLELLATPYFYWVWEAICGHVFGNRYTFLKEIVPKPEWRSDLIKSGISQRPDILFTEGNALYILDAKYYYYKNSLPGWHDVAKQMFYKYTIEQNLLTPIGKRILPNINGIENVFILPEDSDIFIKYLGYVHVNGVDQLGKVQAYAISIKKAMQSYAERAKSDFRIQLINRISLNREQQ